MINTIIFDFDGIIIDTESTEYESWREIFIEYNLHLDFDIWADLIGRPRGSVNMYDYLEQQCGYSIDKEKINSRRLARNRELNNKLELLPGINDYMTEAKNGHMNLAVVSSSDRNWVLEHLSRLKIMEEFDLIVCEEDTKLHKPNPEPYLYLLNKLEIKPANAIAIEDSPNGVKAAISAGVFCVAIPNEITKRLDLSMADLQIESLSQISLDSLLKLAGNHRMQ
jgi:HAD superfamily hydrolase (TIGR01509 family)